MCRADTAEQKRRRRAAKRGLTPVPAVTEADSPDFAQYCAKLDTAPPVATAQNCAVGPCVAAVRSTLAELNLGALWAADAAAAEAMAAILDDRRQVTTQPSAAGKLLTIMVGLRKAAEPRHGRLAAVEAMGRVARVKSRPTDAG